MHCPLPSSTGPKPKPEALVLGAGVVVIVIVLEEQADLKGTLTLGFPGPRGSPVFVRGRPGMAINGSWDSNVTSSFLGPLRVHLPKIGRERQISNSPAIKIRGGLGP